VVVIEEEGETVTVVEEVIAEVEAKSLETEENN
jgi:hypothetical protein